MVAGAEVVCDPSNHGLVVFDDLRALLHLILIQPCVVMPYAAFSVAHRQHGSVPSKSSRCLRRKANKLLHRLDIPDLDQTCAGGYCDRLDTLRAEPSDGHSDKLVILDFAQLGGNVVGRQLLIEDTVAAGKKQDVVLGTR